MEVPIVARPSERTLSRRTQEGYLERQFLRLLTLNDAPLGFWCLHYVFNISFLFFFHFFHNMKICLILMSLAIIVFNILFIRSYFLIIRRIITFVLHYFSQLPKKLQSSKLKCRSRLSLKCSLTAQDNYTVSSPSVDLSNSLCRMFCCCFFQNMKYKSDGTYLK